MKNLSNIGLFLSLLVTLTSCYNSESQKWTKTDMVGLIQEKAELKLTEDFEVLLDSVKHTEGAFDSDYTYDLIIEYNQSSEKSIVEQITNSLLFDTVLTRNYADPIWDIIDVKTKNGIWISSDNGFKFLHCVNDENSPEPFNFSVDTLNNRVEMNLVHL